MVQLHGHDEIWRWTVAVLIGGAGVMFQAERMPPVTTHLSQLANYRDRQGKRGVKSITELQLFKSVPESIVRPELRRSWGRPIGTIVPRHHVKLC